MSTLTACGGLLVRGLTTLLFLLKLEARDGVDDVFDFFGRSNGVAILIDLLLAVLVVIIVVYILLEELVVAEINVSARVMVASIGA